MNFSTIRQGLENIDYAWTEPKTYLVFVPGLSLLIQKIQLANTLPLIQSVTQENVIQADLESRKFANICKWHLRGSMIQIIVGSILITSAIAIQMFTIPLFSLLTILATYEMVDTFVKGFKNSVTFYEFYPNGNIKSATNTIACTIF